MLRSMGAECLTMTDGDKDLCDKWTSTCGQVVLEEKACLKDLVKEGVCVEQVPLFKNVNKV